MLKWLTGNKPIPVWVIKQIDDGLLHLCGQATLEFEGKRSLALAALDEGRFQGAVNMAGSGLVLNARLFAALVPLDALTLDAQGQAHWKGRVWQASQVPQRCWTYEGRLTTQRHVQHGQTQLLSLEDVSGIRRQAQASSDHGMVPYGIYERDSDPLTPSRDGAPYASSPFAKERVWRGDDVER